MLLVKCIRSHENYLNWTSLLDYRAVLLLGLFQGHEAEPDSSLCSTDQAQHRSTSSQWQQGGPQ